MKYLGTDPILFYQSGTNGYEETFVRCHCECHEPGRVVIHDRACCWKCEACGARVRTGMEKRHECSKP